MNTVGSLFGALVSLLASLILSFSGSSYRPTQVNVQPSPQAPIHLPATVAYSPDKETPQLPSPVVITVASNQIPSIAPNEGTSNGTCTVTISPPVNCNGYNSCITGETIQNGDSMRFFTDSTGSSEPTCQSETRVCNNGVMSGDSQYQYPYCPTGPTNASSSSSLSGSVPVLVRSSAQLCSGATTGVPNYLYIVIWGDYLTPSSDTLLIGTSAPQQDNQLSKNNVEVYSIPQQPAGTYQMRIKNINGTSNALTFTVSATPQVCEWN
jgi:hypothetical protein